MCNYRDGTIILVSMVLVTFKTIHMNLVETIQQSLGFEPLQKIDPNTQEVAVNTNSEAALAQAAIPSVLIALYKYTLSDEGADDVIREKISTEWVNALFGKNMGAATVKIADYASVSTQHAYEVMESVAVEAVKQVQQNDAGDEEASVVKKFMNDQRNTILHYLPASLQIGKLLNDTTIDDRTNKMEGPISGLMHAIEKKFSDASETAEKSK